MMAKEQLEQDKSNWFDNGIKQLKRKSDYPVSGKFIEIEL